MITRHIIFLIVFASAQIFSSEKENNIALEYVKLKSNQIMAVNQKAVSSTQEFEEWKNKYLRDFAFCVLKKEVEYRNLNKLKIDSRKKSRRKDEIFTKLLKEIEKKYSLKENEHFLLQAYYSFVCREQLMDELRKNDFRDLR